MNDRLYFAKEGLPLPERADLPIASEVEGQAKLTLRHDGLWLCEFGDYAGEGTTQMAAYAAIYNRWLAAREGGSSDKT